MAFVSQIDLKVLVGENLLTFLLVGGLLVVMYAYRDIRLPATRNFLFIILVLLLMSISNSLERWAALSPDRRTMRIAMSVLHYCLQPCVIWLELVIIIPWTGRNRRLWMFLLSLPLFINTVIYLMAPWAGELVFWYADDYSFCRGLLGYSIYVVTFFYLILLLQMSLHFHRQKNRRKAIILFFLVFSGVLIGILEGMNLVTGYIDEAFALGVILYYMYLVTVHELEVQASLTKSELELSENRVKLLRKQIQPHFIFNSLQIIKSLIRMDPQKATRCVEDFSDYLQANLDSISSDRLIPFEEELGHVEAYVSIALADESKNITMRYDIREKDFRLPPLTIEPLVENAFRHGVPKGGTVTLTTEAAEDAFLVVVSDDGNGFAASGTAEDQKRTGIGLENVRTRLATLCGGTLSINSGCDGTAVTVRIPRSVSPSGSPPQF